MKQTTAAPDSIVLGHRFDISAHSHDVQMQLRFLTSRVPKAAELVDKVKRAWAGRQVVSDPGADHSADLRVIDETAQNLIALAEEDAVMRPYATRVLQALDGLSAAFLKSDEDYAREQLPADRNQAILDKIRELLA